MLVACGVASPARAEPIRYGVAPNQDSLLPVLGDDAHGNWYREEGLDVSLQVIRWRDMPEALGTGKVDVAIEDLASVIAKHGKYPDTVYWYGLSTFDIGSAFMARPGSGLKSVAQFEAELGSHDQAVIAVARQLRNRMMIAARHTEMDHAVAILARDGGLRYSDGPDSEIALINLRPDEGFRAFMEGRGDVYLSGLAERGAADRAGLVELINGADLGSARLLGLVTTRAYAATHREQLLKLLHVWFRTVNYVHEKPGAAARVVVEAVNAATPVDMTVADFLHAWQHYEHYPLNPAEAATTFLDPASSFYWMPSQQACSQYYCSIDAAAAGDTADLFDMESVQADYVARYGEK